MEMHGLTQCNVDQDSDEDSSDGMPNLMICDDNSSEDATVEYSVDSSEVVSDKESVTTVDEDSSVVKKRALVDPMDHL